MKLGHVVVRGTDERRQVSRWVQGQIRSLLLAQERARDRRDRGRERQGNKRGDKHDPPAGDRVRVGEAAEDREQPPLLRRRRDRGADLLVEAGVGNGQMGAQGRRRAGRRSAVGASCLGLHRPFEGVPRLVQAPLDRPDRDSQAVGDLRERPFFDVVEHEDHAVLLPEPIERAADRVGRGDRLDLTSSCRIGMVGTGGAPVAVRSWFDPDFAKTHPMAPRHPGGVGDDPVQPAIEGGPVSEARKLAPRGYDRFLRRVCCVRFIAEDRVRQPVAPIKASVDEDIERPASPSAARRTSSSASDAPIRSVAAIDPTDLPGVVGRCYLPAVNCPDAVAAPEVCSDRRDRPAPSQPAASDRHLALMTGAGVIGGRRSAREGST